MKFRVILLTALFSLCFSGMTTSAQEQDYVVSTPRTEEPDDPDRPFLFVDEMPTFRDGDAATFLRWVMENVRYPQQAQENGVEGRVILSFVVERDGSLSDIEILRSPDDILSEEALRVVKSSPLWTPGKSRNKLVRVKYTLPIVFKLT